MSYIDNHDIIHVHLVSSSLILIIEIRQSEMPLFWFLDDIIYDGDELTFRKLALYSSVCAILVLDLEFHRRQAIVKCISS